MNTGSKGKIAESLVLAELVKRNFRVSVPFSECRYDMVAEKNGCFNRIQVKYVNWLTPRNTIQIVLHSITRKGRRRYTADEIDYFIAYYEQAGKFYVIPFSDVQDKITLQLRFENPANNQRAKITYADRYENRWDLLRQ